MQIDLYVSYSERLKWKIATHSAFTSAINKLFDISTHVCGKPLKLNILRYSDIVDIKSRQKTRKSTSVGWCFMLDIIALLEDNTCRENLGLAEF